MTLITALESGRGKTDQALAAEELMLCIYPNLRRLAQKYLAEERAGHTLQATALVHEAFFKMVDQDKVSWQGRTHFFAISARAMRQVLIDYARARQRVKRGGNWQRISLVEDRREAGLAELDMDQALSLSSALERLAELDPRQAQILEMRCFGGLKVQEIASVLGVSKRTVEGDWAHARVWLQRELEGSGRQ